MKDWEAAYIAGIIDGEGTITLTRIHRNEHRRPCITIASTDKELLFYVQTLTGGIIADKRNYKPNIHKNSFTLNIKKKQSVLMVLESISTYLRVDKKKKRALWILNDYERVTLRNGKYTQEQLKKKIEFEEQFFKL
ncbi:LAGLIDADG family homing endonuclease [Mesobacillus maritimus]|uniref:LAGLIDADG family homing endonuclease n=1 Tax=Mesobacillus maritimus TaxID=1643336 RepID=A0ABS7K440_9BACI|nr:LAGLIDADG family homing endonuclease [Mesobacillus maritimus]MBY0097026.1 LAGLIDADG family homing endonuclease [Mesobacillus maritimus]